MLHQIKDRLQCLVSMNARGGRQTPDPHSDETTGHLNPPDQGS